MLKKLIANLKHNFQIFAIGTVLSVISLLLWTDHQYFFWPPQFAGIMNGDGLDVIAVAVGIGLMHYALKNEKNNTVAGILLNTIAGFTDSIAFVQLIHVIFTGQALMELDFILSCYPLAEILYMTKTRGTR